MSNGLCTAQRKETFCHQATLYQMGSHTFFIRALSSKILNANTLIEHTVVIIIRTQNNHFDARTFSSFKQ